MLGSSKRYQDDFHRNQITSDAFHSLTPKKLLHSDYVTHMDNVEDQDILTRKLFDVNMRLFNTSYKYRKIILEICDYIKWNCYTEKEGYKKPHGFSGANAGISFNIIAYNANHNTVVMINPVITKYYGDTIISESNCGSLTLNNPIEVERSEFIDISYYDEQGKFKELKRVDRRNCGLTIQHEVDHLNGILIYDREV